MTSKEYALLEYFMLHTKQVVTRTMLSEHVWNEDFHSLSNVIDVHVRNLRSKIDDGFKKKLIHTMRGTGGILARRILDPVRKITETARKITSEDLSARVKISHSYEEMERLSGAFNDMISRLEKSFRHIEEFSYQAAHELKTPLTVIKGEAEVGLLSARTIEEYQNILKINLEETDRMLKTIEDLLYLARLDYQPDIFKFKEIDLTEFLTEISQQSKMLASHKRITIDTHFPPEKVVVKADPLHLRRLFLTLTEKGVPKIPKKKGRSMRNEKAHSDCGQRLSRREAAGVNPGGPWVLRQIPWTSQAG